MPRCKRCDDEFEPREANQKHCIRCSYEVAAIIAADTKRRTRFARALDLTGARV